MERQISLAEQLECAEKYLKDRMDLESRLECAKAELSVIEKDSFALKCRIEDTEKEMYDGKTKYFFLTLFILGAISLSIEPIDAILSGDFSAILYMLVVLAVFVVLVAAFVGFKINARKRKKSGREQIAAIEKEIEEHCRLFSALRVEKEKKIEACSEELRVHNLDENEYLDFLPSKYRNYIDVKLMCRVISDYRADTLKDVIITYEMYASSKIKTREKESLDWGRRRAIENAEFGQRNELRRILLEYEYDRMNNNR